MAVYELKRFFLDLIYPNRCPFCNKEIPHGDYFCELCAAALSDSPSFDCLGTPLKAFVAVTAYDDASKPIVSELKNNGNGYAMSAIAFLMYQSLQADGILSKTDMITSVPLHRHDKAKRGYNQSEEIAKELSELSRKPYFRLLKKIKRTQPQKTLSSAERKVNVIGAFSVIKKEKMLGKNVLVIDDVCTTGSTLKEAAAQLLIGGASSVFAAVFAKTENLP